MFVPALGCVRYNCVFNQMQNLKKMRSNTIKTSKTIKSFKVNRLKWTFCSTKKNIYITSINLRKHGQEVLHVPRKKRNIRTWTHPFVNVSFQKSNELSMSTLFVFHFHHHYIRLLSSTLDKSVIVLYFYFCQRVCQQHVSPPLHSFLSVAVGHNPPVAF